MERKIINKTVLLIFVLVISVIFFSMISTFLMPLFMAGFFSALATPLYKWLKLRMKAKKVPASFFTIMIILCLIFIPLTALIGAVVTQAIDVGHSVTPWVRTFVEQPSAFSEYLEKIPYYENILPYRDLIIQKAGELVGNASAFLAKSLSSATKLTVNAIFMSFIMLYAIFYFLMDGDTLLRRILYYLPLEDKDKQLLLHRFSSVTRATVKGTLIIGIMQGTICGLGFALVHIDGPVFWGTLMAVCSIIPAIGTAIIWAPAVFILTISGNYAGVLILIIICGVVAGSLDNFLRPLLVGKDTEMPSLFVLLATLGGITMFGILGIIIGPIIAALFITIWEIYGNSFSEYLTEAGVIPCEEKNTDTKKDGRNKHTDRPTAAGESLPDKLKKQTKQ